MNDQVRNAENALKAFRKLWWFLFLATGVYALLIYFLSGSEVASGEVSQAGSQSLFTLLLVGLSFMEFALSMWFPSEQRIRRTLSPTQTRRPSGLPLPNSHRDLQSQSVLGLLMIGALFAEAIAVYGLLLAFLGISDNVEASITYGYLLILFGAIALAAQRWRVTRMVSGVLREIGKRIDTREIRQTKAA